ncbi:hypothetical protein TNCV_4518671, partial [Trichonephila clavipes]
KLSDAKGSRFRTWGESSKGGGTRLNTTAARTRMKMGSLTVDDCG